MMRVFLLFAALGVSRQAAIEKLDPAESGSQWVKPSYCRQNDCPRFVVVEKKEAYEVRKYESAQWVSTRVSGGDYQNAAYSLFRKLFNYIEGQNMKSEKIPMTSPVTILVHPAISPNYTNTFTMSFYVPYAFQSLAPTPSESDVFLEQRPELTAYVRSFPGFAKFDDYVKNLQILSGAINDSSSYHTDYYYTAGYDSPYTVFNRHNEVWLIANK